MILYTLYSLKREEESTCDQDEDKGEVKNARLLGHHNPPITIKFIPPWEGLPFPLIWGLLLVRGLHRGGGASADLAVLAVSHGLGKPEMHQNKNKPPEWNGSCSTQSCKSRGKQIK